MALSTTETQLRRARRVIRRAIKAWAVLKSASKEFDTAMGQLSDEEWKQLAYENEWPEKSRTKGVLDGIWHELGCLEEKTKLPDHCKGCRFVHLTEKVDIIHNERCCKFDKPCRKVVGHCIDTGGKEIKT